MVGNELKGVVESEDDAAEWCGVGPSIAMRPVKSTTTPPPRLSLNRSMRTRSRVGNGALVSPRQSNRAVEMGPRPRSQRCAPDPGLLLHRYRSLPGRHSRLLRPALANGGHLRRGAGASWCRNPASMIRTCDPAHHTRLARPLFSYHSLGHLTLWVIEPLSEDAAPYAAWYAKTRFTSDAIAAVRLKIWIGDIYSRSTDPLDRQKIPPDRIIRIAQAICHAA